LASNKPRILSPRARRALQQEAIQKQAKRTQALADEVIEFIQEGWGFHAAFNHAIRRILGNYRRTNHDVDLYNAYFGRVRFLISQSQKISRQELSEALKRKHFTPANPNFAHPNYATPKPRQGAFDFPFPTAAPIVLDRKRLAAGERPEDFD